MSAPPRKRLKQPTLAESFARQSSRENQKRSQSMLKKTNVSDFPKDSMINRKKILAAAERRRDKNSPDITPPHSPEYLQNQPTTPTIDLEEDGEASPKKHSVLINALAASEASASNAGVDKTKQPSVGVSKRRGKRDLETAHVDGENAENIEDSENSVTENTTKSDIKLRTKNTEISVSDTDGEKGDKGSDVSLEIIDLGEGTSNTLSKNTPLDCDDDKATDMGSAGSKVNSTRRVFDQRAASVAHQTIEKGSKGTPITELNTQPSCSPRIGKIMPTPHHTVLFDTRRFTPAAKATPFPRVYEDKWDPDHVKMPCSPENNYVAEENGKKEILQRWEVIETVLLSNMTSSLELEEAVLKYNTRYQEKWSFSGLHSFFLDVMDSDETQRFFKTTLPKMVDLALQLPKLCTRGIPLLKRNYPHSVTMSQQQAACLLANAFFCTYPRRNARGRASEYSAYPDINFNNLYVGTQRGIHRRKAEKLKCLVNYFRRVTENMPTGTLTFRRQVLRDFPEWPQSTRQFTRLHIAADGTIEDHGGGMLQVDFANKFVGGGVLGHGCVQEEIRFMLCPEMILSRLITEELHANECLIMTGCERFNNYTGYADSFQWAGNHNDATKSDEWGRKHTEVVAIDALVFNSYSDQFQPFKVNRELNKAWCGFYKDATQKHLSAVATGNWGCGAFGGDHRLKTLIQLMAAAEAKRDVCYFTFSDLKLRDDICNIHTFIVKQNLTVGDVWRLITRYHTYIKSKRNVYLSVFDFIYNQYDSIEAQSLDTDSTDRDSDVEMLDSQEMEHYRTEGARRKFSPDYSADTP